MSLSAQLVELNRMHLLYEAVEPFLTKQRAFGVQLEDAANQIYIANGVDRAFGTLTHVDLSRTPVRLSAAHPRPTSFHLPQSITNYL